MRVARFETCSLLQPSAAHLALGRPRAAIQEARTLGQIARAVGHLKIGYHMAATQVERKDVIEMTAINGSCRSKRGVPIELTAADSAAPTLDLKQSPGADNFVVLISVAD